MDETDERDIEQPRSMLLDRLRAELGGLVREAITEALARTTPATPAAAPHEHAGQEAEIRHLVRSCDQLGMIRDQLASRAGRRQRRRLRVEINTITRLMQANLERLRQLGVTPMPYPERVDYSIHEPVHVIPTTEPAQDGRVLDVCRSGFLRDGRPWRQMQITVLTWKPTPQQQTQTAKES